MAVEDETLTIIYLTDGIATAFPYPFYFRAIPDLIVQFTDSLGVVTTKILNTDYTVSGALDAKLNVYSEGGTVTFGVAPATAGQILITRHTPRAQTLSIIRKIHSQQVHTRQRSITLSSSSRKCSLGFRG